jgi:hypothetical protein
MMLASYEWSTIYHFGLQSQSLWVTICRSCNDGALEPMSFYEKKGLFWSGGLMCLHTWVVATISVDALLCW